MKKLYSIVAAFVALLLANSCGPAEAGYTVEHRLQGLYTVNKATVAPEFSDTAFFVNNIDDFDLKTGDRALLMLHYYYDAYSGKAPAWNIVEILERYPVRALSATADVDPASFVTPLTGVKPLNFFNDFETPSWVWNDCQNINIKYKGVKDEAKFAMTVRGVKDGYVELELFVSAPESEKEVETLLSFDISNVTDFLNDADKVLLGDSIKTKIYTKRMKNGALEEWVVPGNYFKYF